MSYLVKEIRMLIDLEKATMEWLNAKSKEDYISPSIISQAERDIKVLKQIYISTHIGGYYEDIHITDTFVTIEDSEIFREEINKYMTAKIANEGHIFTFQSFNPEQKYSLGSDDPYPIMKIEYRR